MSSAPWTPPAKVAHSGAVCPEPRLVKEFLRVGNGRSPHTMEKGNTLNVQGLEKFSSGNLPRLWQPQLAGKGSHHDSKTLHRIVAASTLSFILRCEASGLSEDMGRNRWHSFVRNLETGSARPLISSSGVGTQRREGHPENGGITRTRTRTCD